MGNFTFGRDEYFKMLDQALNEPIGKIQGIGAPPRQAIDRLLQTAQRKRLAMPTMPRNLGRPRG